MKEFFSNLNNHPLKNHKFLMLQCYNQNRMESIYTSYQTMDLLDICNSELSPGVGGRYKLHPVLPEKDEEEAYHGKH